MVSGLVVPSLRRNLEKTQYNDDEAFWLTSWRPWRTEIKYELVQQYVSAQEGAGAMLAIAVDFKAWPLVELFKQISQVFFFSFCGLGS